MSINYNRAHTKKCVTRKEYLRKQVNLDYPPYWDEGISFYPRKNRGTNYAYPKLYSYQIRMYRTWKHNRRKQWKN
jgi:hypothetical protein